MKTPVPGQFFITRATRWVSWMSSHKVMDVRGVSCAQRHPEILAQSRSLKLGEMFELMVEKDPRGIRNTMDKWPGYSWVYLEQGPDIWRIEIRHDGEAAGSDPLIRSSLKIV